MLYWLHFVLCVALQLGHVVLCIYLHLLQFGLVGIEALLRQVAVVLVFVLYFVAETGDFGSAFLLFAVELVLNGRNIASLISWRERSLPIRESPSMYLTTICPLVEVSAGEAVVAAEPPIAG